jgi:hypothetical protein
LFLWKIRHNQILWWCWECDCTETVGSHEFHMKLLTTSDVVYQASCGNASDFYSGGSLFKSHPRHQLPWLKFSWFSSVISRKFENNKLNYEHFLPYHLQTIIHYHSIIWVIDTIIK